MALLFKPTGASLTRAAREREQATETFLKEVLLTTEARVVSIPLGVQVSSSHSGIHGVDAVS